MCRDGLGPKALIHERALGERCLDMCVGIVDLQRVWHDCRQWLPGMATICGLRWYKNRVVMSYYQDSKEFTKRQGKEFVPLPKKKRQAIITMLYVTSGRIELAESLDNLNPEIVYEIGRAFPMHTTPQSARPVDAFTGVETPRVYSFRISDQWQQVTLYNDERKPLEVKAPLSGDQSLTGSLALNPDKRYYVYDFWNDRLVGNMAGTETIKVKLDPGEALMFSVREVLKRPQVLSTNRHLMQGYVDLENVKCDTQKRLLTGTAKVVGGEPFKIVIANNGAKVSQAISKDARAKIEEHPTDASLSVLVLERPENSDVAWGVSYK
jgi:hypothetical protein